MKTPEAHAGRGPFVPHDEPTLPDLPDAPTLLDLRRRKPQRRPPPMWPAPQQHMQRPAPHGRSPLGWAIACALGASAVLLLSLLSLLGVVSLTSRGALPFPSGPVAQSSRTAPTASATSGSPAASGWLQIAPANVQFGCADHQRTQIVVLENQGPRPVHWQASLSSAGDQAGVAISPEDGDLGAGESTAIQLQNVIQSARAQEVIRFSATDALAGSPASVTVTSVGCG